MAPEVLKQEKYGNACDYWSIGVVAFVMLSGTMPFYEDDNFKLFEQIKNCDYDFKAETWENVTAEAKDFITKILVPNPNNRLNFEQMMEHPWMKLHLENVPLNIDRANLQRH